MKTPTIILAVAALAALLPGCGKPDAPLDTDGEIVGPASERLEGATLMATGGTTLIEKVMDDGGLPELQVDYTADFAETLHESIVFPLTVVTQDADGNELRRRVLVNLDAAVEDAAVAASTGRAQLISSSTAEQLAELARQFRPGLDDPELPEDERAFLIAWLRGWGDS
ncbi:MAG: hypothetical protein OXQ94_15435 [Gemmatimonadota bacterium]|nr:hypothetical protein [Gemmatimonadota bacterium]